MRGELHNAFTSPGLWDSPHSYGIGTYPNSRHITYVRNGTPVEWNTRENTAELPAAIRGMRRTPTAKIQVDI